MKILFLEDIGSVLYPMLDELTEMGHRVTYAGGVQEARVLYHRGPACFDCLIVDLDVPAEGLSEGEYKSTNGRQFAGWVWLEKDGIVRKRGELYPGGHEKLPAVIVYSAYLNEWREKHSQEDYPDVTFVSKSSGGVGGVKGRVAAVDSELRKGK